MSTQVATQAWRCSKCDALRFTEPAMNAHERACEGPEHCPDCGTELTADDVQTDGENTETSCPNCHWFDVN